MKPHKGMRLPAAILALSLLSTATRALEVQLCDLRDGNSYALAACAIEHEKAAQAKLDKTWNQIAQAYASGPEDPAWRALQRSQSAWKAFLKAECNDYVTELFRGASIRPVMVIGCRTQLKIQRYCSLISPNAMKGPADKETCGALNEASSAMPSAPPR